MISLSLLKRWLRCVNNRGIAVIYVALILVVLLAFVGLAIDIGYMYLAKTQLQNAADSAAHAGASKLLATGGIITNLSDARIPIAKAAAVNFALYNKAAGKSIVILSDGTNVLSDTNDVTVGYWDGTSYTDGPSVTHINAFKARPRRTENSPGGKVAIFFGKVIGISEMAAAASAVAALPARGGIVIAFCGDACTNASTIFSMYSTSGKQYDTGPGTPYDNKFAWTTLLNDPTSANMLDQMICSSKPFQNVCNKPIYTNMGTVAYDVRNLASSFYDANYDAANKTFTTIAGKKVTTGWEVIVPVTSDPIKPCPPGSQGSWEPKQVIQYAKVNITAICAPGAASGCFGSPPNLTAACTSGQLPKRNCCINFDNNTIVINRMECASCSDPSVFSGTRPVIVQ
jgi:Flp pilus assembly protein TadG